MVVAPSAAKALKLFMLAINLSVVRSLFCNSCVDTKNLHSETSAIRWNSNVSVSAAFYDYANEEKRMKME